MTTSISTLASTPRAEPRQQVCETHGAFESINFIGRIWSKCPGCTADAAAKEKAEQEAREHQARKSAWEQRLGESCIPPRFTDRTLNNFVATTPEQEHALAFATAYADGFAEVIKTGRSALFVGNVGTGKTHLAAGIALRLMRRDGRPVLFTTVMRAVRSVKDTWSRGADKTEAQAVAALVFPDLLILDEVGVQFGSEAEKLILFDVLNERYEKRRPTLLLSNFDVEGVKAYLGDRIFDRLREDGGEAIPFDWESHRGKVQA
ncbi:ATP-binding protein [Comamonas testosteroni]|uniref:ATP-binding protein n=1 Tax=Comamonas testosteroni TaxID=285 RepID=UPI00265EB1EC|nr:ATP-binding protein [Comamonas testosteroni]WKL14237.1 ATP-binding protein [Comamonas testosteroni]